MIYLIFLLNATTKIKQSEHWFNLYIIIIFSGILIGFINFKNLSRSSKIFLLLLLCTFVSENFAHYLIKSGESNFYVYHIFSPIQYLLVALGYYFDTKNKYILTTIPFVLCLALILSLWIQALPLFNSYFLNTELFLFTIFAIYYMRNLLTIHSEIELKEYPLFWISCGLILFSVSNLFIFSTYNFFNNPDPIIKKTFYYVRLFTNYIYYSMFIVSFLVKQNTSAKNNAK